MRLHWVGVKRNIQGEYNTLWHIFLVPGKGTVRERKYSTGLIFPFKITFFHHNKKNIRMWIMKADAFSSKWAAGRDQSLAFILSGDLPS